MNAENLIRVMLPSVELDAEQSRVLEIYRNTSGEWERVRIDKFAVDGRVFLRRLRYNEVHSRWDADVQALWKDLSETLYRWVA